MSAPMVRAILEGRKTQTRRPLRIQPQGPFLGWVDRDEGRRAWFQGDITSEELRCPFGQPGDRLWVRETCKYGGYSGQGLITGKIGPWDGWGVGSKPYSDPFWNFREKYSDKWCPAIFMPRWASRITLEITDVRVQRLQEISEEDARAEGCEASQLVQMANGDPCYSSVFRKLWTSINGIDNPSAWESNPWVWCVSFRRPA